jgi:hypothetical protein
LRSFDSKIQHNISQTIKPMPEYTFGTSAMGFYGEWSLRMLPVSHPATPAQGEGQDGDEFTQTSRVR